MNKQSEFYICIHIIKNINVNSCGEHFYHCEVQQLPNFVHFSNRGLSITNKINKLRSKYIIVGAMMIMITIGEDAGGGECDTDGCL